MLSGLIHKLWLASQKKNYHDLIRSSADPAGTQWHLLKSILDTNAHTAFGKKHKFQTIESFADFQSKVPLCDEEELEEQTAFISSGASDVLFDGVPDRFEETSGSTRPARLIPFNSDLASAFDKAVGAWLVALHKQYPKAFKGKAYWSLSPATRETRYTIAGIRIGSIDDTEYFSPLMRKLIRHTMVIDPDTAYITEPLQFYQSTARQLLACTDLSLISVWSPGFLLQLDSFMREFYTAILNESNFPIKSARKQYLNKFINTDWQWTDLWPGLSLVSVWTHAQAGQLIEPLRKRLGNTLLQGKGLLSTEAVVSIPLIENKDPVLVLNSTVIEGMDIETEAMLPVHKWQKNHSYQVYITTQAGLYRYTTGDIVQVTDFYQQNPCIRFMGRGSRVVDLVGEKLSEFQALRAYTVALENLAPGTQTQFQPAILIADMHGTYGQYTLCTDGIKLLDTFERLNFLQRFEQELKCNPYYKQAINLGEINEVMLRDLSPEQWLTIEQHIKTTRRMQDGDFKMPFLIHAHDVPDAIRQMLHN